MGAAPAMAQRALRWTWSVLGLKLGGQPPDRFVLGWEVRRARPDFVLLGAESRIGMPAELLLMRQEQTLLFDTFVEVGNPFARALWAPVEPAHRPVVRCVLQQGIRSSREGSEKNDR
jgi:hypothetical protein